MINRQNSAKFVAGAGGRPQGPKASTGGLNSTSQAPGVPAGVAPRRPSEPGAGLSGGGDEPGLHAIWALVREELRRDVGAARFDNWFSGLDLVAEVEGEVLIAAKSELDRDRVERGINGYTIQGVWNRMDPRRRIVTIEARERIPSDILALAEPQAQAAAEAALAEIDEQDMEACDILAAAALAPHAQSYGLQTLDNFMVGESNRIAFGLARRLAVGASVSASVVTLFGPHGVGKTHLMRGVQSMLAARNGENSVIYMSAEDFMLTYVDGVKKKDTSDLRTSFRRARVVLLDDFQFICSKPGTLVEFFSHLRAVVASGGVVVLACDKTPSALEQLDERMRDEIQGGVVVKLDLPERSLRREIVRAKADEVHAENAEFIFPDEWVDLVADKLPSSGRVLSGAVRNAFVGTVMVGEPLSRAAVDKAIQIAQGAQATNRPKIDTIKDVTAKAYGVSKADLESPCRKRQFAQPRQFAMYMCRQLTTCSYPQIGRMFGDRDHTTVLFAFRKISRMVEAEPPLAEELRQLEQKILTDPRNNASK